MKLRSCNLYRENVFKTVTRNTNDLDYAPVPLKTEGMALTRPRVTPRRGWRPTQAPRVYRSHPYEAAGTSTEQNGIKTPSLGGAGAGRGRRPQHGARCGPAGATAAPSSGRPPAPGRSRSSWLAKPPSSPQRPLHAPPCPPRTRAAPRGGSCRPETTAPSRNTCGLDFTPTGRAPRRHVVRTRACALPPGRPT